ncbi:MAG: hypothetical protein Q7S27_07040 [Nanoarchaeota archaeon]|nr:hypothetical protein [Nanoarchaeota archaeon]
MTSKINILGDSDNNRISRYDKDLARKLNEETEKQIRQEKIKAKLDAKNKPKQNTITESTPPTISPPLLDFKYAFFLGGEFGKQINQKVQERYGFSTAITKVVYNDQNKVITGSTPFYVTAVNEILKEQFPQFRTATHADLEKILKSSTLKLSGYYEDTSLVLRTKQDPNSYLAQDLFEQFKSKGINLKEDSVYVLPLFTLKLRKDNNSIYKLSFNVTDSTIQNFFDAPILFSQSERYFNSVEMDEKTGLPTKIYTKQVAGNRQLWIRDSGLAGLCLNRVLDINSNYEYLSNCDTVGRVVVVSNEDPSKFGVNI